MKKNYCFFILLLIGTVLASCKKDDIVYQGDFDKSYKVWIGFKTATHNSYRYMTSSASWTGYSSETIITVKNGKVTGRAYTAKKIDEVTHQVVVYQTWNEDEGTLNTHQSGASTLTLDDLYEKAKTEWLLKRKDAKSYFEANNDGMISSCGYFYDKCADDCFIGISIRFIQPLLIS